MSKLLLVSWAIRAEGMEMADVDPGDACWRGMWLVACGLRADVAGTTVVVSGAVTGLCSEGFVIEDCSMSLSRSMMRSPMPPTSHSLSSYSKFDSLAEAVATDNSPPTAAACC